MVKTMKPRSKELSGKSAGLKVLADKIAVEERAESKGKSSVLVARGGKSDGERARVFLSQPRLSYHRTLKRA